MPKSWVGDFSVYGIMSDGSRQEFVSDAEYVEALRDADADNEE